MLWLLGPLYQHHHAWVFPFLLIRSLLLGQCEAPLWCSSVLWALYQRISLPLGWRILCWTFILQGQMKLERQQILSLFIKVMKKFYKHLYAIAAKEIDSALPRLKEVTLKTCRLSRSVFNRILMARFYCPPLQNNPLQKTNLPFPISKGLLGEALTLKCVAPRNNSLRFDDRYWRR